MWFGTEDGLNKYNGYDFTTYQLDPNNPFSISSNIIRDVHEDRSGILWIATNGGGLNRFDRSTEQFVRYQNDPNDPNSISSDYVWSIYEDDSGTLWIGTDGGGLNKLVRNNDDEIPPKFIHYKHEPNNPHSISHDRILKITGDRSGKLWIGTRNGGLNRFDPTSGHVARFIHDPNNPNSLSHNTVRAILQDASDVLWIGTDGGGLNKLDFKADGSPIFTHYRHVPDGLNSLSDDRVWAVHEIEPGIFLIATNGGGLNYLDSSTEDFIRYQHDPNDPYSIGIDYIYSIYEDRAGIVWIGTDIGGISKLSKYKYKFALYQNDANDINSLSDNNTWSFYEDEAGDLWIGTRGGGLNRFDRKTDEFSQYRNNPSDSNSLPHDHVRCIYSDRSGTFWLGTDGGGLSKFIPGDNDNPSLAFINYQHDPRNPNSISGNRIYSILEDDHRNLWVATRTGGLNKLISTGNQTEAQFASYQYEPDNPNSLGDNFVYKIYQDRSDDLWIGTFTAGLDRLIFDNADDARPTFEHYRHDVNDSNSLSNNCILTIYEDRSGSLWVGTGGGGVNKLIRDGKNSHNARFVRYTEEDGLANDFVYGILEDDQGHLWLSTNRGFSKFNPKTETFKNYDERDGLQSNEFNGGAYYKNRSGKMFFGGINGFNAFYPDNVLDNPYVPSISVTDFQIFNKPVSIGEHSPLKKHITETAEIGLSYTQNIFSFEIAALDYTTPDKNQYKYMMEGFDKDWIFTDADNRIVTYMNLDPGEYVFRVRGSNNDAIWNEEGTSIRIIITPPIWETWWLRVLVALGAIGLAFVGYQNRLRHVRMKIELQAAHNAQMSIMPQSDPQIEGLDISGECIPASEVGGDFFDYMWMDDEKTKFCIAIGDVSGKAMTAAMTAVMSSGMIYSKAERGISIKEMMTRLNRPMYLKTDKQMFTALCLSSLNLRTKELTFTNAGLVEPILKSENSVTFLQAKGSTHALGMIENNVYAERNVQLKSGDALVFATDGVTEGQNHSRESYGEERLKNLLLSMSTSILSAKEIRERIIRDVKNFSGKAPHDDMTVIVVKVLEKSKSSKRN